MTLAEWCERTDHTFTVARPSLGVLVTTKMDIRGETIQELYHLSDYKVSTVSGPVIWLVRKRQ